MKAQVQMQMLVYILAIAVTAIVLVQGFKAINGFINTQCQAELLNFQNLLARELDSASQNYGSVKNLDVAMPCKHHTAVFVDMNHKPDTSLPNPGSNTRTTLQYPLIVSAWQQQTGNVFLIPTAEQRIDVGSNFTVDGADANSDEDTTLATFQTDQGYLVIPAVSGHIRIRIEGRAGYAMISAQ